MHTRHDQDTPYGQVISNKCHEEGVLQNKEQLDLVEEIGASSLFNHRNLLPLLDDASMAEVICSVFFFFALYLPMDAMICRILRCETIWE
jgi:hypothetical protein